MSSETDHPRQRTVAELLAAHGGSAPASGRRRRRREADESDGAAAVDTAQAAPETTALPHTPPMVDRAVLREPVPHVAPPVGSSRRARTAPPPAGGPPPRPVRENPTDVIPRVREPQPVQDLAGPLPRRDRPARPDDGPSTEVGMAPVGAEDWHAERTAALRGGTSIDGGPPLPAAPRIAGDGPAGLGSAADLREPDGYDDHGGGDDRYDDAYDDPYDDRDDGRDDRRGYGHRDDRPDRDDRHDDEDGMPSPRERRLGRAARDAAPAAWSAVLVQWLAGALGGAVLWVAFRFLWRSLPVVAVAAAIVVVVGLVLLVRSLLHNSDRRTTVFAVLVGLLLTVSPAILVVLGR